MWLWGLLSPATQPRVLAPLLLLLLPLLHEPCGGAPEVCRQRVLWRLVVRLSRWHFGDTKVFFIQRCPYFSYTSTKCCVQRVCRLFWGYILFSEVCRECKFLSLGQGLKSHNIENEIMVRQNTHTQIHMTWHESRTHCMYVLIWLQRPVC